MWELAAYDVHHLFLERCGALDIVPMFYHREHLELADLVIAGIPTKSRVRCQVQLFEPSLRV